MKVKERDYWTCIRQIDIHTMLMFLCVSRCVNRQLLANTVVMLTCGMLTCQCRVYS